MTLQRPKEAVAQPQQGGDDWEVDVTFTRSQQREFRRVTTAVVGHLLAMVDREGLITAPTVQEPLTSRHLEIVGLTKARAERLARTLSH
jgi:preprotein translocase subunit SecD